MPTIVVVGLQWGDEAKGKVVDLLSADAGMVVRFTGGNNAGHTVLAGGRLVKFHLLPAGLLHPHVRGVITSGAVICPKTLVGELDGFADGALTPDRLVISRGAHVVLPYHSLLDAAEEEARGDRKLGTTRRGIGPAYVDKFSRVGLRMGEFVHPERMGERLGALIEAKSRALAAQGGEPLDREAVLSEYGAYADRIRPFVGDAEAEVAEAVRAGRGVLFEGAHGTLLDVDLGTYPYVTATHTTAGGACLGSGIGPTALDRALGVMKAYTTRVGEGPMPTELTGPRGDCLREKGKEYGTTTGRPRRCGWLDLFALRYAATANGVTDLAVTRLDVLSGFEKLRVCTAYTLDGQPLKSYPLDTDMLARCEPVYETVPGWSEELESCRRWEDLPETARSYVTMISESLDAAVSLISVGPDRSQTIVPAGRRLWEA